MPTYPRPLLVFLSALLGAAALLFVVSTASDDDPVAAVTTTVPATAGRPHGAGPRCEASDLVAAGTQDEGAAGSGYTDVYLVNVSEATCDLLGYPTVRVYAQDGSVSVDATPAEMSEMSGDPDEPVRLEPGGTAVFTLRTSHVCGDQGLQAPSSADAVAVSVDDEPVSLAEAVPVHVVLCDHASVSPYHEVLLRSA